MNLAQEFKSILIQYGHNVYVQKRRDETGSGPYMRVAGGKYETHLHKYTAWRRPLRAGATASADGFAKLTEEGLPQNYDLCYYFESNTNVKASDLIIEDTPNEREPRQVSMVKKAIPYYLSDDMIFIAAYSDRISPTIA